MNKKLDAMDHSAPATHDYRAFHAERWTSWNTVRTVAPLLAMICFTIAFYHLVHDLGAGAIGS